MSDEVIHAKYLKFHDKHYKRLGRLGKWLHRLSCNEAHE